MIAASVAALADTVGPVNPYTTGSIVVNNAVKGETYYAIKALGATMSDDGIAYTGNLPNDLASVFEVKTITDDTLTYQAISEKAGVTADQIQAAMRAFANTNSSSWGTGIKCEDNSVTFENLEPGYYVIVSTLVNAAATPAQTTATNKVMAVSTYDPNATAGNKNVGKIYEKNETTVTVTKGGDTEYSIGDTVTYTVTFNGVNYVGEGENARIIVKMEVKDTLPEFLTSAAVTKIKIGETEYAGETLNETNFPGVTSFGTAKKFDIPWATKGTGAHDWTSKYANGTAIEITYTATLTDTVKVDGTAGNKNTVTITPYVDEPDHDEPQPREEDWKDHHEIYTHAAALIKVDENDVPLKGAKFQFYGLSAALETADVKGIYRVTGYDASAAAAKTAGQELEVGDDGKLIILGISKNVTLVGKETVAPDGYNLLTSEVSVTPQVISKEVWSSAGKRYYDADDNLVAESSSTSHEVEVTKTIDELNTDSYKVVNKKGTQLPSTGGIGTTIFYVAGGILVLAAVILLVTKRRMGSSND